MLARKVSALTSGKLSVNGGEGHVFLRFLEVKFVSLSLVSLAQSIFRHSSKVVQGEWPVRAGDKKTTGSGDKNAIFSLYIRYR